MCNYLMVYYLSGELLWPQHHGNTIDFQLWGLRLVPSMFGQFVKNVEANCDCLFQFPMHDLCEIYGRWTTHTRGKNLDDLFFRYKNLYYDVYCFRTLLFWPGSVFCPKRASLSTILNMRMTRESPICCYIMTR